MNPETIYSYVIETDLDHKCELCFFATNNEQDMAAHDDYHLKLAKETQDLETARDQMTIIASRRARQEIKAIKSYFSAMPFSANDLGINLEMLEKYVEHLITVVESKHGNK